MTCYTFLVRRFANFECLILNPRLCDTQASMTTCQLYMHYSHLGPILWGMISKIEQDMAVLVICECFFRSLLSYLPMILTCSTILLPTSTGTTMEHKTPGFQINASLTVALKTWCVMPFSARDMGHAIVFETRLEITKSGLFHPQYVSRSNMECNDSIYRYDGGYEKQVRWCHCQKIITEVVVSCSSTELLYGRLTLVATLCCSVDSCLQRSLAVFVLCFVSLGGSSSFFSGKTWFQPYSILISSFLFWSPG